MRRLCVRAVLSCGVALVFVGAPAAYGADPYEPNEVKELATGPLVAGQTYAGEIDRVHSSEPGEPGAEDEDWYWFSVVAPGPVSIAYDNDLATTSCFGPEAQLIDPAGVVVGTAQPPKWRTDAIAYDVPAAGDYYLRVHPYTIEPCPPPDEQYHFTIAASDLIATPVGQTAVLPRGPVPSSSTTGRTAAGLGVISATLKNRRLRVVGKLARGASLARVRVHVLLVHGRAIMHTLRARRVLGGRWVASGKLPSVLRKRTRLGVRAAYLGDATFAAKRLPVRIVRAR